MYGVFSLRAVLQYNYLDGKVIRVFQALPIPVDVYFQKENSIIKWGLKFKKRPTQVQGLPLLICDFLR